MVNPVTLSSPSYTAHLVAASFTHSNCTFLISATRETLTGLGPAFYGPWTWFSRWSANNEPLFEWIYAILRILSPGDVRSIQSAFTSYQKT